MRRRGYRAARLFTGETVLARGMVVVCDERIEWVGVGEPPGPVSVVDLGDATLLPGLIDAHSRRQGINWARCAGLRRTSSRPRVATRRWTSRRA